MEHYSYYPGVLQFEISSVCNAQCPGCVRTVIEESDDPNVNTDITTVKTRVHENIPKNAYLSLDVFKSIFTERVRKKLNCIEFVGTIDDPLVHPEFPDMIDFIVQELPDVRIVIHTNGSLRTPDYFETMSRKLRKHPGGTRFCFNIDGLSDTNSLYRRNTNFEKIIDNARAYIRGGAYATWQYLIFPWNKHQVNEAREFAAELGFKDFVTRNDRALAGKNFKTMAANQHSKKSWEDFKHNYIMTAYTSAIDCVMRPRGMYFVNFEGNVWPCCFLNNSQYTKFGQYEETYKRFEDNYDAAWNNLHHYTMDEILNHRFYTEDLVDSWEEKEHTSGCKGRILKCTATCSKKELEVRPFADHQWTTLNSS